MFIPEPTLTQNSRCLIRAVDTLCMGTYIVLFTRNLTRRSQVLQTVYRRKRKKKKKQTKKHLALKRLKSKWYKEWGVIIMTASVICRNILSFMKSSFNIFTTNSGTSPSCLSHEWKKPKTWNVVGDKFRNLLSISQVCAVHRFWVMSRIISRNFAEFCI